MNKSKSTSILGWVISFRIHRQGPNVNVLYRLLVYFPDLSWQQPYCRGGHNLSLNLQNVYLMIASHCVLQNVSFGGEVIVQQFCCWHPISRAQFGVFQCGHQRLWSSWWVASSTLLVGMYHSFLPQSRPVDSQLSYKCIGKGWAMAVGTFVSSCPFATSWFDAWCFQFHCSYQCNGKSSQWRPSLGSPGMCQTPPAGRSQYGTV